jgi:hypothetical protein
MPLSSKVDVTTVLAFILDLEPLIDSSIDAQSRQLDNGLAHLVARCHILIPNRDCHVVSDILDIDFEHLEFY